MIRVRLDWAARVYGASNAYVQVEEDYRPSLSMADRAGFSFHHVYHYRIGR